MARFECRIYNRVARCYYCELRGTHKMIFIDDVTRLCRKHYQWVNDVIDHELNHPVKMWRNPCDGKTIQ